VVDELPNLNNKKLVELRKMVALLGVGTRRIFIDLVKSVLCVLRKDFGSSKQKDVEVEKIKGKLRETLSKYQEMG
jgi:hypothetical protein